MEKTAKINLKTELNQPIDVQQDKRLFVQVIAGRNKQRLRQLASQLATKFAQRYQLAEYKQLYRLQLGPLANKQQAEQLLLQLKNSGYNGAYMLYTEQRLAHN